MTPEENETLTRVGPGTPGGEMLRRYWWPVWFEEKLENKPIMIRLLGETFVLFRDGKGKIGMLDHICAHRRASLEFGRVEEKGIRCCYHGWLYGADGQCLEMPAEPPGSRLCRRGEATGGANPDRRWLGLRLYRPDAGADPAALRSAGAR